MSKYIKQPLRKSNTKIQKKKSRKSPAMIKVGLILKIQRFSKHIKSNKWNLRQKLHDHSNKFRESL